MPPRHKKKRKNRAAVAQAAAAAAAAKRRDWRVGDLVIAKLRGYRPWPAQIQRPEDYGYQARPHKIFVTFFGTEDTCFCTQSKITPFTSAMRKTMAEQLQKINTNPELEKAIKQIFAADDELKVSMRSQNNSDDENAEEEDKQPSEPSIKPPPWKKAKIASQEHAAAVVVQQPPPLVHSAGKESARPTRAGTAAAAAAAAAAATSAATSANRSKQEETIAGSSVEDLAAHQLHKLPRKVRIKVSSKSPDMTNHAAAATDKETPSPPQYWGSPKAPAEADGFNNGDVVMEDAAADTDVAKGSGSPKTPSQDSDTSRAEKEGGGNSYKSHVFQDVKLIGEEAVQERAEKDSESTAAEVALHALSKLDTVAVVAAREAKADFNVEVAAEEEHLQTDRLARAGSEGTGIATGLQTTVEENLKSTGGSEAEDKDRDSRKEPCRVADPKEDSSSSEVAAAVQSAEGTCESMGALKADEKEEAQADVEISHVSSTTVGRKEEKVDACAAFHSEVRNASRTVEERRDDLRLGTENSHAVAEEAMNCALPPTPVANPVKDEEKAQERDPATITEQKLEEASADIKKGKAPVGDVVEDVKGNETCTTVRPPHEEKVSRVEYNLGTEAKVTEMEIIFQEKDEAENLKSIPREEKPMEKKTETTTLPTVMEQGVKDQDKDGAAMDVTMNDTSDGAPTEHVDKLSESGVKDGVKNKIAASSVAGDEPVQKNGPASAVPAS